MAHPGLPTVSIEEVFLKSSLLGSLPDSLELPDRSYDREDEGDDISFYAAPRLFHHMDPAARYALRLYFEEAFEGASAPVLLELCASWASHLPELREFGAVIGVGLNAEELSRNGSLTGYVVHDLNAAAVLPGVAEAAAEAIAATGAEGKGGGDGSSCGPFDFVTCVLGLEYLTSPVAVLSEALRLLQPGGSAILAFSSRISLQPKAVRVWAEADVARRAWLAAVYLHLARTPCGAWRFSDVEAIDLSPDPGRSDGLYVVRATKTLADGAKW